MPEMNGEHENPSRLDRIEKAIEFLIADRAVLDAKFGQLADNHTQLDEKLSRLADEVGNLAEKQRKTDEIVNRLAINVNALSNSIVPILSAVDRLVTRVDEIGGKLDGLIHLVESDHRDFNERLKRLETIQ